VQPLVLQKMRCAALRRRRRWAWLRRLRSAGALGERESMSSFRTGGANDGALAGQYL
jgi:hypothetical protein